MKAAQDIFGAAFKHKFSQLATLTYVRLVTQDGRLSFLCFSILPSWRPTATWLSVSGLSWTEHSFSTQCIWMYSSPPPAQLHSKLRKLLWPLCLRPRGAQRPRPLSSHVSEQQPSTRVAMELKMNHSWTYLHGRHSASHLESSGCSQNWEQELDDAFRHMSWRRSQADNFGWCHSVQWGKLPQQQHTTHINS